MPSRACANDRTSLGDGLPVAFAGPPWRKSRSIKRLRSTKKARNWRAPGRRAPATGSLDARGQTRARSDTRGPRMATVPRDDSLHAVYKSIVYGAALVNGRNQATGSVRRQLEWSDGTRRTRADPPSPCPLPEGEGAGRFRPPDGTWGLDSRTRQAKSHRASGTNRWATLAARGWFAHRLTAHPRAADGRRLRPQPLELGEARRDGTVVGNLAAGLLTLEITRKRRQLVADLQRLGGA